MLSARVVRVRMAYREPSSGGIGRCLTENWSETHCDSEVLTQKACLCYADGGRKGGLGFRKDLRDLGDPGMNEDDVEILRRAVRI